MIVRMTGADSEVAATGAGGGGDVMAKKSVKASRAQDMPEIANC